MFVPHVSVPCRCQCACERRDLFNSSDRRVDGKLQYIERRESEGIGSSGPWLGSCLLFSSTVCSCVSCSRYATDETVDIAYCPADTKLLERAQAIRRKALRDVRYGTGKDS